MNKLINKLFIFLNYFLILKSLVFAQTCTLQWVKKAGGIWKDGGYDITTDASDNILATGFFQGTAIFGAGEINETILIESGENDIFTAKYSQDGVLIWVKKAGGIKRDIGYGIATDRFDNVLVTGCFTEEATFGAGETNETILVGFGKEDIFVAKYDPSGVLLWVKNAGHMSNEVGYSIATDDSGNILVTGRSSHSTVFGAGEVNETTLISTGLSDVFIAKYAPNGLLLWAKNDGGSEKGTGMVIDDSGNILLTGRSSGTSVFGAGQVNEKILIGSGETDIFTAKYTSSGDFLWARKDGGPSIDDGCGIAVDNSGNILVTGFFGDTATFGAGEANETILIGDGTGYGELEIFIAKYTPDGGLLWAKKASGSGMDFGEDIFIDDSGNILVIGHISDITCFGAGDINETTLVCNGIWDTFIAKYNPNGDLLWAKKIGGTGYDTGHGITMDGSRNILVTGLFSDRVTFGEGEVNKTTMISEGYNDFFVAKYSDDAGMNISLLLTESVLKQNYPNPFNPETTIIFKMPVEGHAILKIYNMQGQVVRVLFDGNLSAKQHQVVWDGKNDRGNQVPAGIYFYNLQSEGRVETRKMALIK